MSDPGGRAAASPERAARPIDQRPDSAHPASAHPGSDSERTRVRRVAERGAYDRETLYRIFDEGLVCHVGFTGEDGQPWVIPMAYARRGDRLLLHGSVLSRLMRATGEGVPVCATVTHLDGLVLARSTFHHSMNYRSAVVVGRAEPIRDRAEKLAALDALVEHLVPGRAADARGPSEKELAATEVLAVPIDEASAKVRTGGPRDAAGDLDLDVWAGVVPLTLTAGAPETAADGKPGLPVPPYAARYRRRCASVPRTDAPEPKPGPTAE